MDIEVCPVAFRIKMEIIISEPVYIKKKTGQLM